MPVYSYYYINGASRTIASAYAQCVVVPRTTLPGITLVMHARDECMPTDLTSGLAYARFT
jgi:hypothetical protein